jgi:hypothetical protein
MKTPAISRQLIHALAAITLGSSLGGCYVRYHDPHGHPYRHEHWHGEDVYRHEDGRWYANRNGQWVVVEEVDIR